MESVCRSNQRMLWLAFGLATTLSPVAYAAPPGVLEDAAASSVRPAAVLAAPDSRHVVLIRHAHVAEAPREHLDPCAFDPDGAILLLTEEEIASLTVPFERRGSLADYVRRFRPVKTMAAVGVPSVSRLLGEPVGDPGPRGAAAAGEFPLEYDR